jgi:hypothetical protein
VRADGEAGGAVKAFIVERLACFGKPSEVADAVKEEFGVTIHASRSRSTTPRSAAR